MSESRKFAASGRLEKGSKTHRGRCEKPFRFGEEKRRVLKPFFFLLCIVSNGFISLRVKRTRNGRLEISQIGKQVFAICKLHSIGSTNGRYCRKDFCLRRPIESFFVDTHAQPPLPYELGKIRVYHRGQIHPQFFCEALRLRLHLRIDSYAGCHGCHK